MGNKKTRIYLDSCFFVAIFNNEKGRVETCVKVMKEVQNGNVEAIISTLVVAESAEKSIGNVDAIDLFKQNYLQKRVVDFSIADKARNLIRSISGLKGADAVHLITAMESGCDYFFTYDGKIRKKSNEPGFSNLKILEPLLFWENQPNLPGIE